MASQLWKRLNGVFCIYKPPLSAMPQVRSTLTKNLAKDLNKIFVPKKENLISIEGSTSTAMEIKISEKMSVHPLAIGEGFDFSDIRLRFVNHLASTSSGVCLVGVNNAMTFATAVSHFRLVRAYRISGELGYSTSNLFKTGKVMEKSKYAHVTNRHLEKVFMIIQATHQKRAMELLGAQLDTQNAFQALADEGIVRPGKDTSWQLFYSLKCIEFNPPDFTIEVSCINENEDFLKRLIHDIGLLCKTNATTTKVQCIRYGPFTVDDALLNKHWRLDEICDNIEYLRPRFDNLVPDSPSLKQLETPGS